MQERVFKDKEVIFWEGSIGLTLYRIIEGTVAVIIGYGTEDEKKLTELGEGRIFGEMAVLEAWPRSATVIAVNGPVRALEIESGEVSEFFSDEPDKIKLIMNNLSHRLRELTDEYMEVCETISEIRRTRGEKESRGEGLLSRISKFLRINGSIAVDDSVLEAMETYENIEKIKEEQGQARENLRFKKGQVIFRQDSPGDCMYYIGYGCVGIYRDYGTKKEKLLTTLHANEFFGEMGLIEKLPRSATAVVMNSDTVLTRITEEGLDRMFEERPGIVLLALQHISSRLRALTKDYVKACRIVTRMIEEEKDEKAFTEDEEALIQYYTAMAQMQNNRFMYY